MRCGIRDAGFGIRDSRFGVAVLILLTAFCANAQEQAQKQAQEQEQEQGVELSGFRVPEYDDQGVMTSQLFGDHAELQSDSMVKITGVRMEFYRDGETFMEVASPYCIYNRNNRKAHSDAAIRADMEGVHLTGTGFRLDTGARTVQVLADSRVVIDDIMQQTDLEPENGVSEVSNVTVITSRQLFLSYTGRSARFVENVHVEDPQLQMDSGLLEIRFGENNEIDWIEALADVRIFHEGREAYAGKAVYDVITDEFLLEDNPKLVDGRNMLFGETIRFWRATGKMICEPFARMVLYPDEKLKTDFLGN